MLSPEQLNRYLDFAVRAAQAAGDVTLNYFPGSDRPCPEILTKSDDSPVTIADRNAEKTIREMIQKEFPDHGLFGEEFGQENPDAEFVWIIDPIDGTKSFIRGVPMYGVLVALEYRRECVVGVIHHPPLGETLKAAKGLGCFWNDRPTRVSTISDPSKAMVLCTNAASCYRKNPQFLSDLLERTTLFRGWCDCYGYTLLATGRAEVMLDPAMAPWDCAAILPIMEEAGGTFTTWSGERTIHGPDAVGTNGALQGFMMELMEKHAAAATK